MVKQKARPRAERKHMDSETYIKNGVKIIEDLVKQKSFQPALASCQELLKVDPYHRTVQKLLKKIQERILEENIKKVDRDIDTTMGLWKEKRYDELFAIYTRLYQYAPQHNRLTKLIKKLEQSMSEEQKNTRRDFVTQAHTAIRDLLKQKQYADALQAGNELLTVDPLNTDTQKMVATAKEGIVEQKLQANARIVDSADFERALEFYNGLLAIDPTSQKIQALAFQAKARLAEQHTLASRIHFNESLARMRELFQSSEYEKTVQACDEILHLDSKNVTAKIFRKKALHIIEIETEKMVMKRLKEGSEALVAEYQKEPGKFAEI